MSESWRTSIGETDRSPPVKVVYLITELSMGGAQRSLHLLLKGLNRERFSPEVVCLYNGEGAAAQAIRALDIPVFDVQIRRKADLGAFVRLMRHIRDAKPVILHTSLFHANLPGRIIGRILDVPIIISSERTMAMEREWRYRLNRWTIGFVDRVVVVSGNVGEFCIRHVHLPMEKLVLIYNGIEVADPQPEARQKARLELATPPDIPLIGAVSRLEPVKGIDILIKAYAASKNVDHARLVIIGEGTERERLEKVAERLGVANRTFWAGYRPNASELLPAFDLFVQPSLHEGLPNAVLEAMAAGLAVVATNVGGTPEVVENGETGLLVPPNNSAALASAIDRLMSDPTARSRMGLAGRRRVEVRFTVEEMVRKTEALYDNLLREKGIVDESK